ncbi:hypothetical protein HMSLTHF_13860 [Vreelandella aquamarina]|uniref:Uncharacterized protein n=1 Tax=Vreelandella aquamarina TaxID=77097 RepID=A0A6F8STM3_9GAMM|nr:hypothetical protein HMSLTHF_13860 [Halomonas meridiana]
MEHASSLGGLPGIALATLQRRESIECRHASDLNDSVHLLLTVYVASRMPINIFLLKYIEL